MALVVGAVFSSFREFDDVLKEHQKQNHVLFVKECARRIKAPSPETDGLIYESVVYVCKQGEVRRRPQITDGSRPNQCTLKCGCAARLRIIRSKVDGRLCLKITQCHLEHNHIVGPEIAALYPENRRLQIDSTIRTIFALPSCSNRDVHNVVSSSQSTVVFPQDMENLKNKIPSRSFQLKLEPEDDIPIDEEHPEFFFPESEGSTALPPSQIPRPVAQRRPQKRKATDEDELLALVRRRMSKPHLIEDQFTAFGKNIEHKMRNLAMDQRIHAEKLITDVLYEAEQGNLDREFTLSRYPQVIMP